MTPLWHVPVYKLSICSSCKNTLIVSGKKLLQVENNKGETVMDLACTEEMKRILTTTTQQRNILFTPTKSRPDSQGTNIYHPHPKNGEGTVFTGVCPHRGRGLPQSSVLSQVTGPRSFPRGGGLPQSWVPPGQVRMGYPPSQYWGTPPPPRPGTEQQSERRAVCLLRSHRTVLLFSVFQSSQNVNVMCK